MSSSMTRSRRPLDVQIAPLVRIFAKGFPIVDEIQRSGRWPPYPKQQHPVNGAGGRGESPGVQEEDLSSL